MLRYHYFIKTHYLSLLIESAKFILDCSNSRCPLLNIQYGMFSIPRNPKPDVFSIDSIDNIIRQCFPRVILPPSHTIHWSFIPSMCVQIIPHSTQYPDNLSLLLTNAMFDFSWFATRFHHIIPIKFDYKVDRQYGIIPAGLFWLVIFFYLYRDGARFSLLPSWSFQRIVLSML